MNKIILVNDNNTKSNLNEALQVLQSLYKINVSPKPSSCQGFISTLKSSAKNSAPAGGGGGGGGGGY